MNRPRRDRLQLCLLLLLSLTLGACAKKPAEPPVPVVDFSGFYSELKPCRDRYKEIDAKIDAAGVRDPAFYRVPGFPYFRTDRLLASYRNEVHDINNIGGWVRRMRELDQEAREFEYENLGWSRQEIAIQRFEFLNCGRGLSALELDDPEVMKRLLASVQPPDDEPGLLHRIGLAPLLKPLLRDQVEQRQEQIRRNFRAPLTAALGSQPPALWQVEAKQDASLIPKRLDDTLPDELGLPGLFESAWVAIAEANAPRLLAADGEGAMQLGTPVLTADGPAVDPSRPWVNYQIGFTRFGGRALVQVDYFFWFGPGKAAAKAAPGSRIDGFVWRVTLDDQLRPLAYDSVRASGLDHIWFAVQDLPRQPQAAKDAEPVLFPQDNAAPANPMLVLDAGRTIHHVIAASNEVAAGAQHRYELQRYEDLFRLERPGGGSRSLFATDGTLNGAHAALDGLALLSGIPELGTPRHLAHLPAALIERRSFEDPFLLSSVFAR